MKKNKTKKSNIFAKIFSIFMICCFAFLSVGCMGESPEDYEDEEDFEDSEISTQMPINMYGTKVLYRPDTYDFDSEEDFYGQFAWHTLNELVNAYGLVSTSAQTKYFSGVSANDIPLLYDSIRYKVDTIGTITADNSLVVGADLNNSWKWSFDYNLSENDSSMNAFLLTDDENSVVQGSHLYNNSQANISDFKTASASKYGNSSFGKKYKEIYIGAESATDYDDYSDYVKALEYVVYSYALGIEPENITVTINDNVSSSSTAYYSVTIGSQSPDEALTSMKTLFSKRSSLVGLAEGQIDKIGQWITENVIGIDNDTIKRYSKATKNTSGGLSFSFDSSSLSQNNLGRNYQNVVDKILENACANVSIGEETIDKSFLASEIKEYAGTTFFIFDDINFPKYDGDSFLNIPAIQPLEYQSATVMLKESIRIDEIWIALKYDADLDGTTEGVWDTSKYLDIVVEINYFNYDKKKLFTLGSQQTRVFDGPYDAVKSPEGADNHGILMFGDFETKCQDKELVQMLVDGSLVVKKFNPDIGSGVLKTNIGDLGYTGIPPVSSPLVLVGTHDARKYYSIVEPKDGELSGEQTYLTGRLNEEKFKGNDGCDYLEITYKVIKTKGDINKNYKFYTGIAAIFEPLIFDWD